MAALSPAAAPATSPFHVRGMLPWHNFLCGPTAWNEADWRRYLDWMKQQDMNLLVLHCYTGGAQRYVNYVEPMIRIEYRNVLPLAGFDTSLTARWGYRPLAVDQFAFGTEKLFPLPAGAREPAFGSDAAVLARNNADAYDRAQALIRRVLEMAHERGIKVAMGFEAGVYPPELYSILPPSSYIGTYLLADPTHPASQELLRIEIDNMLKAYPGIDWIWVWLQEHVVPAGETHISAGLQKLVNEHRTRFSFQDPNAAFTGAWSLEYIRLAHDYLKQKAPTVRLAISGWGGANQLNGILPGLDHGLPRDIVFTCLNPAQGLDPQPAFFADIARHREVWVIPWLEGDAKLWHPQPRVGLLRDQLQLAAKQGATGTIAIHWRTEDIRANMAAYAEFSAHPGRADVDAFYRTDCHGQYGPAAQEMAPLLERMDREQWFEHLHSPEYYPYEPSWGRLKPEERARLAAAAARVQELANAASDARFRGNLEWLWAKLDATLLLDQVSADLEPAYRLQETGQGDLAQARAALARAPIGRLLRTHAAHVRSRGELGILSSMNQRLWLLYLELRDFLAGKP